MLTDSVAQKINGVCTVAPPYEVTQSHFEPILNINANWIAVIPYAFCNSENPTVQFDHSRQWWGETSPGIIQTIQLAKQNNLKVMLKPHLWVMGDGWAGDLSFDDPKALKDWQESYQSYILHFSKIADSLDVDLISIGTELKKLVSGNDDYWIDMICDIRNFYGGPITYSANWDNYKNISFWEQMDYIGIDAYFPVSDEQVPSVTDVVKGFQKEKQKMKNLSLYLDVPILFTEFGFRSIDYCANGHWISDYENTSTNLECQKIAYNGLFETFWDEPWFAGGFLWKWFFKHKDAGGNNDSMFTPQNKPVEDLVKYQYQFH